MKEQRQGSRPAQGRLQAKRAMHGRESPRLVHEGRIIHAEQSRQAPKRLETLGPSAACLDLLKILPSVLDEIIPLNQRHRQQLPHDIRRLWEDLTSEKEHRSAEYLGSPAYTSAYCRYFLPWNILRLASTLGNAPLGLGPGAVIMDLGSGPLTLPIALYAARPELREIPLRIYCVDRTPRILAVGKAIFESICAKTEGRLPPWEIILSQLPFGKPLTEKADLLTEANMFNEFFWKGKASLGERALQTAGQLLGYIKNSGSIFLMEPGDPRSGAFISATRAALAIQGAAPVAPCPHRHSCPMPGIFRSLPTSLNDEQGLRDEGRIRNAGQGKSCMESVVMPKWRTKYPWCHFTLDAAIAPSWLQDLSRAAGLPKEKMVFSYLVAHRQVSEGKTPDSASDEAMKVRVISESFSLPGNMLGCYACSREGFTLLRRPRPQTPTNQHEAPEPGDLLTVQQSTAGARPRDEKSGAIIVSL
ncbi:MAG: small ribosomal subunit Rsm22 family protein [Spirochaetaceae bacterium]|nr:small ribosomal subunit Rsm22 family protein [Spirochaetaceae bacterium]